MRSLSLCQLCFFILRHSILPLLLLLLPFSLLRTCIHIFLSFQFHILSYSNSPNNSKPTPCRRPTMKEARSISSRSSSSETLRLASPICCLVMPETSSISTPRPPSASNFRLRLWISTAKRLRLRFGILPARSASELLPLLTTAAPSVLSSSTISAAAPLSTVSADGSTSSRVSAFLYLSLTQLTHSHLPFFFRSSSCSALLVELSRSGLFSSW